MKRRGIFFLLLTLGISSALCAQRLNLDSIQRLLKSGGNDTLRITWLTQLSSSISEQDPDSALKLCMHAMELAQKPASGAMVHGLKKGKAVCCQVLAEIQLGQGDERQGMPNAQRALKLWKELLPPLGGKGGAYTNEMIGAFYKEKGEKEKALRYMEFSAKCFESCGDSLEYAMTLGNISNIYHVWGDIDIARKYLYKALPIFEALGDEEKKAMCLISIAQIFKDKGNYSAALENALTALNIFEKLNAKKRIAWGYQTVSAIYLLLEQTDKGLEYCEKALALNTEIKNRSSMLTNMINLGSIYTNMGLHDKAIRIEERALSLINAGGNPAAKANLLCNMGVLYSQKNDYKKAMEYFKAAMEIVNVSKDKKLRSNLYGNMGEAFLQLKKYPQAEEAFNNALRIDTIADYRDHAGTMYRCLSDVYFATNRYKESLLFYAKFSDCKDSVYSHQKNEEITRSEMNYEFEKREAAEKALQEKKDAVNAAEIKQQNVVFRWALSVLILISVFASLILISLRKARKQKKFIEIKNKETEEQKKIIEHKNKDILDSIHYAKRIQTSLQPSEKFIERNLSRLHSK